MDYAMTTYRTAHTGARVKGHHRAGKRMTAPRHGFMWGFQMAVVTAGFLALSQIPGVFPW